MPPPTAPIAIGTASTVQPIPIEPGNTLKKKLAALNMTAQKPNATREVIFFPAGAWRTVRSPARGSIRK